MSSAASRRWRALCIGVLVPLAILGASDAVRRIREWLRRSDTAERVTFASGVQAARSHAGAGLPPAPAGADTFILNAGNARLMTGEDDPGNERWCDIAGNYYSQRFTSRFSYRNPPPDGPAVWIRVEPRGDALRGRLEARGLKPNFAYQIKLCGDFADRAGFERIGRIGRWRLPGRGTNYGDWDYWLCLDKANVEAYVLFDFFITNERGNAIKEFVLDRSGHVLWNRWRQRHPDWHLGAQTAWIVATNAEIYARPKASNTVEEVYIEPEAMRYYGLSTNAEVRLPPGRYQATLRLTEESFHSVDRDGGWWATPLRVPIEFEVSAATQPGGG